MFAPVPVTRTGSCPESLVSRIWIRSAGPSGVCTGSTPDGPALRIQIRLTRLSGHDPVRVTGTGANTVYTITAVGPLPVLGDGGPELLVIDMLPSRCDPHGLGESYRTSLIDLVVALGDAEPRPFVLTPDDDVRRRLETFAVDTCHAGD